MARPARLLRGDGLGAGRICLAGGSLDRVTGGNLVTAALPLRTLVTARRAEQSDVVAGLP